MRKYTKREAKEYNIFRAFFQWLVVNLVYGTYYKVMYRVEVQGKENIEKDKKYVVAANHLTAADPFLVIFAIRQPTAYMAKAELFESNFLMTLFLDWLGAFVVNRDKLDVSTIKTVYGLKKSSWHLGLFPQGKRDLSGKLENVSKGFAVIAQKTGADILPIGIVGADKKVKIPFTGKIIIKIGKPIEVSDNVEETVDKWCMEVAGLANLEYEKVNKWEEKVTQDDMNQSIIG